MKKLTVKEAFEKYSVVWAEYYESLTDEDNENVLKEVVLCEFELDDMLRKHPESKVYGVISKKIKIDAERIVEAACEDLHEDAYDQCDIDSLQKLLDAWCEKQTGATACCPDYSVEVDITTIPPIGRIRGVKCIVGDPCIGREQTDEVRKLFFGYLENKRGE